MRPDTSSIDETDMSTGERSTEVCALIDRLCDPSARVVYFPVRHHSPACAAALGELIDDMRPAAVLIEGPYDFNPYLDELFLGHELPIAIFSYLRDAEGEHRGAYYPFCEYSPEWIALQKAREQGCEIRLIDLPWIEIADVDRTSHRYADADLRRGRYVRALCDRLGVEDFDDLWDKLIECQWHVEPVEFLRRVHTLCFHIRLWDEHVSEADRRREAFMADQIRSTLDEVTGRLLVVTGGFHSGALAARLEDYVCPGADEPQNYELRNYEPPRDAARSDVAESGKRQSDNRQSDKRQSDNRQDDEQQDAEQQDAEQQDDEQQDDERSSNSIEAELPPNRGIALTTYSYARLDNLTGYDAGMPSPGFYAHVWRQRCQGETFSHAPLLRKLAMELRGLKQTISTADLIAVETSAHALAAIRGRAHVWRRDLIDAVTSSLIKDELEYGCASPYVDAVHAVLRGQQRGRLADQTRLPPLVADVNRQLKAEDLKIGRGVRNVEFDLLEPADRVKSRLLHRLSILEIVGYERSGGTDFLDRQDLTRLWESWRIVWSPEFESRCIEAARYGPALVEAATARLEELASEQDRSAAHAAAILVQAAQAGIETLSNSLLERIENLIRHESDFRGTTAALKHLLFLYCHDEVFGTANVPRIGAILAETVVRSLWLLESLGQSGDGAPGLIEGMSSLLEAFERGAGRIDIDPEEFADVLDRVERDADKPAQIRGAATGILWTIGRAESDRILADLKRFADPSQLGDFLVGLFALARETTQRHPQLLQALDGLLLELVAEDFQQALPALRLAFTYFTPREKHYMLGTLFESLGMRDIQPLQRLIVDEYTAAEALALEDRIFSALANYGLEGQQE